MGVLETPHALEKACSGKCSPARMPRSSVMWRTFCASSRWFCFVLRRVSVMDYLVYPFSPGAREESTKKNIEYRLTYLFDY